VSDGNETNDSAPVSEETNEANGPAPVSEHDAHEPHIQVLKGEPTEEELAALIAVLGSVSGGPFDTGPQERNMWGHPVDKLRYGISNYQRITLQEKIHMRR
jgi:acyl-CoA carboxylase epsilon subunit